MEITTSGSANIKIKVLRTSCNEVPGSSSVRVDILDQLNYCNNKTQRHFLITFDETTDTSCPPISSEKRDTRKRFSTLTSHCSGLGGRFLL